MWCGPPPNCLPELEPGEPAIDQAAFGLLDVKGVMDGVVASLQSRVRSAATATARRGSLGLTATILYARVPMRTPQRCHRAVQDSQEVSRQATHVERGPTGCWCGG